MRGGVYLYPVFVASVRFGSYWRIKEVVDSVEWVGDSFSTQGFSVTLYLFLLRRHSIFTLPNAVFLAGSVYLLALSLRSLPSLRRRFLPTCRVSNPKLWSGRRTACGTPSSSSSRRKTTLTGGQARLCRSMIRLYSSLMLVRFSFPYLPLFGSWENEEKCGNWIAFRFVS